MHFVSGHICLRVADLPLPALDLRSPDLLYYSKGGKRSPPFIEAKWGSGGRRFKSSHPDFLERRKTQSLGCAIHLYDDLSRQLLEGRLPSVWTSPFRFREDYLFQANRQKQTSRWSWIGQGGLVAGNARKTDSWWLCISCDSRAPVTKCIVIAMIT